MINIFTRVAVLSAVGSLSLLGGACTSPSATPPPCEGGACFQRRRQRRLLQRSTNLRSKPARRPPLERDSGLRARREPRPQGGLGDRADGGRRRPRWLARTSSCGEAAPTTSPPVSAATGCFAMIRRAASKTSPRNRGLHPALEDPPVKVDRPAWWSSATSTTTATSTPSATLGPTQRTRTPTAPT